MSGGLQKENICVFSAQEGRTLSCAAFKIRLNPAEFCRIFVFSLFSRNGWYFSPKNGIIFRTFRPGRASGDRFPAVRRGGGLPPYRAVSGPGVSGLYRALPAVPARPAQPPEESRGAGTG